LPFSYIVTTGNEACLDAFQFVDYMLDDGQTDIFLMFLEDIKDPARFAAVAQRALRAGKPIVVTKIGHSAAGQRAAASHTAALAGEYSSYRAMFERYGVIEGRDIEEIVDIAAGFSYWGDRLPAGKRVGIVTGSGGAGGWMADTAGAAGLRVPTLDPQTRALIDAHLPSYGTSQNPVDGTAGAIRTVGYSFLCETVAGSNEVDAVIAITSARQPGRFEKEFDNLSRLSDKIGKPVMFCSYTTPGKEAVAVLSRAGYPLFTNMRNCTHTLAKMADYRALRERFMRAPVLVTPPRPPEAGVALAAAGDVLCEYQAKRVLACYGLDAPGETLVHDADGAIAAAATIDGPVVLKVQSPDILHKTEAGVVALDLVTDAEIRTSYNELIARAARHDPGADLHGVLVQPMAPPGHEIILGINRDATFGPMMMVGLGGIHVEVLGDVAFSPVPLSADDARHLLDRLRGVALLHGVRGQPPADIDALVNLMVRVARLADDWCDDIAEIDLNPVLVHEQGQGVSIVDALIIKQKTD
jgi:acyl-CoA synthetase (NDP forming)